MRLNTLCILLALVSASKSASTSLQLHRRAPPTSGLSVPPFSPSHANVWDSDVDYWLNVMQNEPPAELLGLFRQQKTSDEGQATLALSSHFPHHEQQRAETLPPQKQSNQQIKARLHPFLEWQHGQDLTPSTPTIPTYSPRYPNSHLSLTHVAPTHDSVQPSTPSSASKSFDNPQRSNFEDQQRKEQGKSSHTSSSLPPYSGAGYSRRTKESSQNEAAQAVEAAAEEEAVAQKENIISLSPAKNMGHFASDTVPREQPEGKREQAAAPASSFQIGNGTKRSRKTLSLNALSRPTCYPSVQGDGSLEHHTWEQIAARTR